MKLIAQNFTGYWREIILGMLFKLAEAVLELLVPLVMAGIIDVGVAGGDMRFILQRGGIMLALAVVGAGCGLTCQYFAAVAGGHFGSRLRRQVYAHVMSLSAAETAKFGAGSLITRMTNDTNAIQVGVNMVIRLGTRAPFLIIGGIIMSLLLNVRIGLIFLATTALIILVLVLVLRRTLPGYTAIQNGQDELSRLSGENLEGVRVIRAFSRQKREKREFAAAAGDLTRIMVRVGRISVALSPVTMVLANLAIALVVWLGAGFAYKGEMEPGIIIALVNYMNTILLALVVGANLLVLFTRALASARRVAEVLETAPSVTDGPGAEPVEGAPGLAFEDVCFAYPGSEADSLCDVRFAAAPGQVVGVIGGTGSGKTTLVSLIMRDFDVGRGSVRLLGADVRRYTLGGLRGRIGLVPQGAVLYTGTVRHNLQMARPDATDEQMWRALEVAQAADFIRENPEGLGARILEGGTNLSGGQRQRLTIARAVLREPELLILDDASSALDYATDAKLRKALRQFAKEGLTPGGEANRDRRPMTTLMVSQRAAALRDADLILVLDEGQVVGVGTHDGLVKTNDVFREICESQGTC